MRNQFEAACKRIVGGERTRTGIGTLGEKTLHSVLKLTFEPDEAKHEIKIGPYYADICSENTVTEIQTGNFNTLRNKLSFLLEEYIVSIVYPIANKKWLVWLNNETGEVTKKRKSPKIGNVCEVFYELYKIKQFLTHPNLRLCIVSLDLTEYRLLDGWSVDRKKGSSRYERIPERFVEMTRIDCSKDYNRLIPQGMLVNFTAKDFKKASGLSLHNAQTALNVLKFTGAVVPIGKQRNSIVYKTREN